ncbi:MAG TPA: NAD(P)-dependent oxidoreductase [Candidatus Paceibacterota bacterium]|nr:NAD(P)-dependent oxidoreductase [Candidatus Paceibacterota bacterium]
MKIHYFAGEAWEEAYVREKLPQETLVFHEGPFSSHADVSDPDADALCVFVESKVTAADMDRFPKLKLIATRSTGYDHVDLAAAKERGISVATVPFYGENTVAEFAFALILALSRRVIEADEQVRRTGTFDQSNLRGFDLAGKTLGVVGCGHIGMHVIRMGNGFGMNVIGFETRPDPEVAKAEHFTYASLPDLLAQADIITLHVPYNEHTHHLLNAGNIGSIKKGAFIINTSRGAVIETDALIKGLKDGTIGGAGLDVLEEEGDLNDEMKLLTAPHPNEIAVRTALENHYLIDHPRVIVTPHVAFNTLEAVKRILDTTADNIRNFTAGSPSNIVA